MILGKSTTNASAYNYIHRKLTLLEKLIRAKERVKAWKRIKDQRAVQPSA